MLPCHWPNMRDLTQLGLRCCFWPDTEIAKLDIIIWLFLLLQPQSQPKQGLRLGFPNHGHPFLSIPASLTLVWVLITYYFTSGPYSSFLYFPSNISHRMPPSRLLQPLLYVSLLRLFSAYEVKSTHPSLSCSRILFRSALLSGMFPPYYNVSSFFKSKVPIVSQTVY